MTRPFPKNHPRGMVLLEVITALTIFTLVAFSLIIALSTSLDVARERNEIEAVTRGLNNQMALLHASQVVSSDSDLPDDGTGSGIFYHLTVQPEQMFDQKKQPVAGMYRATITAKWLSDGLDENRSVSELIYQP